MTTVPQLGYNQKNETTIDTFNQWFRQQPEYQRQLSEWGVDPNDVHLAKSQSQQLLKLAQKLGAVVDEGDMEVDPSGNMNPKGHKLRNTLLVAGIAGATIGTMGLAGAFAGGAGATMPAATGIGGLSATSAGLGTTAGLGTAGLAPLASTAIGTGMATGITGGTGLAGGGSGMGIGSSILSGLKGIGKNLLSSNGTEVAGKALGNASQAQASNRGTLAELMLDQNDQLERQLLAREQEKRQAQDQAYRNSMLGDRAATWQPLKRPDGISGTYQGPTANSQAAGSELYKQGMDRLNSPDLKTPTGMPTYNNMGTNPQFQDALKPGAMEKITGAGSWGLPLINALLGRK